MRYQDIVVGEDYGLRMRLSSKEPLHHVQVTQKVDRNKHVKVRHVDGESEGMEEFFPFRNVVVPIRASNDGDLSREMVPAAPVQAAESIRAPTDARVERSSLTIE